ncbi:unnamed protein product [Hanseniaspora opuntiae]
MKFSESLKYNSVPEWKQYYINYNGLKKFIYALQKKRLNPGENDEEIEEILEDMDLELELGVNDIIAENSSNLDTRLSPNGHDEPLENEKTQSNHKFRLKSFKDKLVHNKGSTSTAIDNNSVDQNIELSDMKKTSDEEHVLSVEDSSDLSKRGKGTKKFLNVFSKKNKNSSGDISSLNDKVEDVASGSSSVFNKDVEHIKEEFISRLVMELNKIDSFFSSKEIEFTSRFNALMSDIEKIRKQRGNSRPTSRSNSFAVRSTRTLSNQTQLRTYSTSSATQGVNAAFAMNGIIEENPFSDEDDDDYDYNSFNNDADSANGSNEFSALLNSDDFNIKSQKRAILKKALINVYVDISQLRSFSELNKIGFTKIVKKVDKVLEVNIKEEFIHNDKLFENSNIYNPGTINGIDDRLNIIVECFAKITENDNYEDAKQDLRSYLRDYIVWERSTVWKDMLGLEYSTKYNITNSQNKYIKSDELNQLQKSEDNLLLEMKTVNLFNKYPVRVPKFMLTIQALKVTLIVTLFIILLCIKTFNDHVQKRCMAMLALVALFWATEAIPLFVTALLVPLLSVVLLVYKAEDGSVMTASKAASTVLAAMWSGTIMVLFAGFTLSAALTKYNVAKVLASYLLSAAGQKPRNVLLMVMSVVFFLSMWISNVASPVLTYSLCQPVLRTLNADAPFAKALVLGVAFAADFGGMASPISSPQNVFSMNYLKPYGVGWGQFFAVALPCGVICLLLVWGEMCLTFDINKHKIQRFRPIKTRFTVKQWFVCIVTVVTILLWCLLTKIPGFGSAGIIAVIPIVLFFGSGMLNAHDLSEFPWTIILLAMGGIALGSAVQSSGLLSTIGTALQKRIENFGQLSILAIFGIIMLVFGTFVSHTVAAIIIVPLVQEVGSKLPSNKAAPILIFGCCLLASCGMALPSSGFPNITAFGKLDDRGKNYLTVNHFLTRGIPSTFIGYVVIITIGFGIMNSIFTNVNYVSQISS